MCVSFVCIRVSGAGQCWWCRSVDVGGVCWFLWFLSVLMVSVRLGVSSMLLEDYRNPQLWNTISRNVYSIERCWKFRAVSMCQSVLMESVRVVGVGRFF